MRRMYQKNGKTHRMKLFSGKKAHKKEKKKIQKSFYRNMEL